MTDVVIAHGLQVRQDLPLPWGMSSSAVADSGAFQTALNGLGLIFWVGLVPASLLSGPCGEHSTHCAPSVPGSAKFCASIPSEGCSACPSGSAAGPRSIGLYSFVWLELAPPDPIAVPVIRAAFAMYAVVAILVGVCFGVVVRQGHGCEVRSSLIGWLAPPGAQAGRPAGAAESARRA